ncbi:hypothetical protein JGI25_01324, partial [Candidatus Kryptobacter tengchongensis]
MFLIKMPFKMLKANLKLINKNPIGIMISSIQFLNPAKISLGNSISIFMKSIDDLSKIRQIEKAKKFVKMKAIFLSFGERILVKTSMLICLFSL